MPTYYTPTTEDLVWGLEFQRWSLVVGDWVDEKIEDGQMYNSASISLQIIRIKHLDEEDIISLGWIPKDMYYLMEGFRLFIGKCGIEIVRGAETLYSGICKNKAELKRLMVNLNIQK